RGRLWLEVAPLSFPVRFARGDRLCQLRLARGPHGNASLARAEVLTRHRETPLVFEGARALDESELRFDAEGALLLRLGPGAREPGGGRAAVATDVVTFAAQGRHAAEDFWEAVHARGGHCVLEPGRFYLFASLERVRVPPDLAAEMLPVDVGIGELRNNYAG